MRVLLKIIFILLCLCAKASFFFGQGVIVNEISNGTSGTQEYVELIAIGQNGDESCGPIDLRGFMVDDNNGDFSGGPAAGTGIAQGHLRFSSTGPWGTIPAGAILLIYNSADKNTSILLADDPYDANNDSVYIIPDTNSNLQRCTTLPSTSNAAYSPGSYSTGGAWATTNGLRNTGDAIQVRDASAAYFHGIGYGSSPMNGGPDNIFMSGTGAAKVILFLNNVDDNYRSSSNFSMMNAAGNESPGTANNADNQTWIDFLRTNCSMPLAYGETAILNLENELSGVMISWEPKAGMGIYTLLKSETLSEQALSEIRISDFQSASTFHFLDSFPIKGKNRYLIRFTSPSGKITFSDVSVIYWNATQKLEVFPNPSNGNFLLRLPESDQNTYFFAVYSLSGKRMREFSFEKEMVHSSLALDLADLPEGVYFLHLKGNSQATKRIVICK